VSPNFGIHELKREFVKQFTPQRDIKGLEFQVNGKLLTKERPRDLEKDVILAVYPAGLRFKIDGVPTIWGVPNEGKKTVAMYKEIIKERNPSLTGKLVFYFHGRILPDYLMFDTLKLKSDDVVEVFHFEMGDTDLWKRAERSFKTYRFSYDTKIIEVRVPTKTTVGAALRQLALRSNLGLSNARKWCALQDKEIVPNSALLQEREEKVFIIAPLRRQDKWERDFSELELDEQQELDRMVVEAEARKVIIPVKKLASKFKRLKDMEKVWEYVNNLKGPE
jgi:hypothetical protein